jgi:hypothetical protein
MHVPLFLLGAGDCGLGQCRVRAAVGAPSCHHGPWTRVLPMDAGPCYEGTCGMTRSSLIAFTACTRCVVARPPQARSPSMRLARPWHLRPDA